MAKKSTGPPGPITAPRARPVRREALPPADSLADPNGMRPRDSELRRAGITDLAIKVFLPHCLRLNVGTTRETTRAALVMAKEAIEEISKYFDEG